MNAQETSSNTGYGLNLTYGKNDRCPDGKVHCFWFHWLGEHMIDQCVHCGQGAQDGVIPYAD